MANQDAQFSPDVLLRHAAAGDAARALDVLRAVSATKLLDAVFTQAELAVDDDSLRPAGIDAIAELDRAAIEVMDLPQGAVEDPSDESAAGDGPTLVGWELATVAPHELEAAAMIADVRSWQLALVAFADDTDHNGVRFRRVVAAAADGRLVAGQLRFTADDTPELLDGIVVRNAGDLAQDAGLAVTLLAALRAAARGI